MATSLPSYGHHISHCTGSNDHTNGTRRRRSRPRKTNLVWKPAEGSLAGKLALVPWSLIYSCSSVWNSWWICMKRVGLILPPLPSSAQWEVESGEGGKRAKGNLSQLPDSVSAATQYYTQQLWGCCSLFHWSLRHPIQRKHQHNKFCSMTPPVCTQPKKFWSREVVRWTAATGVSSTAFTPAWSFPFLILCGVVLQHGKQINIITVLTYPIPNLHWT